MSRILGLFLALFVSSTAMAEALPNTPEQIGRLAAISGAVAYHTDADAPASEAAVNYPLTTGNRIATPARAHATVDIAAGRFYLDGDSAMTIGALGPGTTSVVLEKGALILHILEGGAGQVFVIETPRGALRADQPGYFEVEVAAEGGTVSASALEGGAQFAEATVLSPGTRATIASDAAPVLAAAVEDDFIRRIAAEVEDTGENKLGAPKYVSPQITAFFELQRHGLWEMTEEYGWVWEPQVMSEWAPFTDGRWVEIKPWGRTWVDNAPWGFAPAHYGRWVEVNSRWAWVPDNAVPADAPEIAGFFNAKENGGGGGGWVPLGPEEPHFSSSPVIVNNVRVINRPAVPKVVNTTTVNNTTTTNITNVEEDRTPSIVVFPAQPPSVPPPQPPSVAPQPRNLTGLGAAGTPMGSGVGFPGN
jgi:hypothetical protein